ncbi:mitochondrial inner membrane protease subunit 1 isoform X4 [Syngnathoides biaculeatus]|uniref:mitochondrial inner membrane protease subunit 1 isoform X4 n=1 Tax=Syngnathoides biaculeatus TaxID=300417 RepID=UPI002ADD5011|nr:mitochondrial inner membrane protease subunit 1 isoform X4 [Syngnathoides biaculeatus]XP_061670281.1 mitochondrial inner membrane protease subunit 1 isoform X4 [Syngnathoides biaculeatus]XP_061670282.1 mitochondrial inner membrane protease subunit 1 isoform X4 [Syngnathoides biaculeatus]
MFRRVLGKTLGFVGYTIQYGCIAHCAFEYIGEIVVCSGPSMEPTIVNKDVVFSERMTRHLCKIQKGDIVIAKSLFDPNMNVCKRVIGLEGDKVYMSGPSNLFKTQTYVPKGHVWLEGDNLGNSTDSRSYGPVPYALIRGRVCLKTVRLKQTVCPTDTTMHLVCTHVYGGEGSVFHLEKPVCLFHIPLVPGPTSEGRGSAQAFLQDADARIKSQTGSCTQRGRKTQKSECELMWRGPPPCCS